jgi:hypothetical protein
MRVTAGLLAMPVLPCVPRQLSGDAERDTDECEEHDIDNSHSRHHLRARTQTAMRWPRARLCAGKQPRMVWVRPIVEPSERLFGATAVMNMNTESLCTNIFSDGRRGRENDALNPMSVMQIDES